MPSRAPHADHSPVCITTDGLSVDDVYCVAVEGARVEVEPAVEERVGAAHEVVERALAGERLVYGLNTLLGHLRDQPLSREELGDYQERIVAAHGGGVGDPLPDEDVRAIMTARVAGLARGASGAHPGAMATLVEMLNEGVHPLVPEIGSVGASDLMHMAAIAQVVMGRGHARYEGEVLPGLDALARAEIKPHRMRGKDGLALISANGASIGLGALAVVAARRAAALADHAGAMSLQLISGNISPFDEEVAAAKPFPGQIEVAAHMRDILADSYLIGPDVVRSVQDPLSFRVIPQVHGALREQIAVAERAVQTELNAADDNPFVSVDQQQILSNGNFHPMVLALAFEALRVGLAHVGMISERRMNKVIALRFDQEKAPLQQMVETSDRYALSSHVVYSAAAIVSELKHLANPITLNCPPLDLDVEDHATLAPMAVGLTRRSLDRLETLLAIEVLLAVDARELQSHRPRLGTSTWRAEEVVRRAVRRAGRTAPAARAVEAVRVGLVDLMGGLHRQG